MKKLSLIAPLTVSVALICSGQPRTPLNRAFLQSDLDGNSHAITNLSGLSAATMTNTGLLSAQAAATDANGKLIAATLSGLGAQWATVVIAGSNAAVTTNSTGGTNAYTVSGQTDTNIANIFLIFATNNDTLVSNALFSFAQQQTNNFDTIVDVNGKTNLLGSDLRQERLDSTNSITSAWIQGKFPGLIVTNGETEDITVSNNFHVDATHALFADGSFIAEQITSLSSAGNKIQKTDGSDNLVDAAFSDVQALLPTGIAIVTNNYAAGNQPLLISNRFIIDAAHRLVLSNLSLGVNRLIRSVADNSLASSIASGAVPINADSTATTFDQVAALGTFLTNNETLSTVFSNTVAVDAAHQLIGSNFTTGRVLFGRSDGGITNVSASGAVPLDADGTATTSAQVQALFPGLIVTNGETQVITVSNTFGADAAHFMNGPMSPSLLTNGASGGSRIQITDANKKVIDSAASGAVPIDADGTATTAAQISALVTINSSGFTNNFTTQVANYNILTTDFLVFLSGARTATLPTAVGAAGKMYIIKCSSAGTNAILTTSAQTIDTFAKWTNTALNKFTWLISDGANWKVIGQN